jgi:S-methyl-5-thioribose-1-phosphate isomerase
MRVQGKEYRSVWMEQDVVKMVDQRLLPHQFEILACPTYRETAQAIRTMAIRGAGAIGAAAGYAMAQAALEAPDDTIRGFVEQAAKVICSTRPTAHDLFYAVSAVREAIGAAPTPAQARQAAVQVANRLADENAQAGEQIGEVGMRLLRGGMRVLTHCNTGWLAFADWGSALAPIYQAHRSGVAVFVYVTQTMPRAQGVKLTAWELSQEGVPHTVIADTAAGHFFQRGEIDCVIVGADRIAANGDVANKIGTYTLALLARQHRVPFYVAAPRSTFDLSMPDGASIPIEERSEDEVLCVSGLTREGRVEQVRVAPDGSPAKNPAFDITPASLITGFVTEAGVFEPRPELIAQFVRGSAPTRTR